MRWEKHGDIRVLKDRQGWTRAVVYREEGCALIWYAAAPFGFIVPIEEYRDTNLRKLQRRVQRDVRAVMEGKA